MRQFLDKVRENKALREKVEEGIAAANKKFLLARAGMDDEVLNTALLAPKQEISLESSVANVMSVEIPQFKFKRGLPIPTIYSPMASLLQLGTWTTR